jgi:hypothetical protein
VNPLPNLATAFNQSQPTPISQQQSLSIISSLTKQSAYTYSSHALERLNQSDRCFTVERMLFILKFPKAVSEPVYDAKYNEYRYCVKGFNKRHVVVALNASNTAMVIITVY